MVAGIYIGSTGLYAGKNTLSIGLGLRLRREGYNPGYIKPIGNIPSVRDGLTGDDDAFFVQDALFPDSLHTTPAPLLITQDLQFRAFTGQEESAETLLEKVKNAYLARSIGHDVMLAGGMDTMFTGHCYGLGAAAVIKKLGLRVVIIDRVETTVRYDLLAMIKDTLEDSLAGVILNAVPASLREEMETVLCPFLERQGIKVLGLLPYLPRLSSIRADALAERLRGRLLTGRHGEDRRVEHFLIGTMQVDNFVTHFKRSSNAAVIVGGDRADVQLIAIEGHCSCLILTGNLHPNEIILARAAVLNVPVIAVHEDTYAVASWMEHLLQRHKLRDMDNIGRINGLVDAHLDFDLFCRVAGLDKK